MTKDAFDRWQEWENKPIRSRKEIDVRIWRPVSELSPEDRLDRQKVNEAVERHNNG